MAIIPLNYQLIMENPFFAGCLERKIFGLSTKTQETLWLNENPETS
jgi:hypothetical protein